MAKKRKEIEKIVEAAEEEGWRRKDKGDKAILFSPDGESTVTVHWTPSDGRWKQNTLRDLRRGGFEGSDKNKKGKK